MEAYAAYKDSGVEWIGEIPSSWKMVQGKYCLRMLVEQVGEHSQKYDLLTLSKTGVNVRDLEAGGKFPASFDTYKVVKPRNLVFCLFDIDETPRTVGLSNHYGMITGAYDVFETIENIDERFVYYLYLTADFQKALKPWYTGLRKTISPFNFLHIKMPVPEFGEQRAIADFLDTKTAEIDGIVEEAERSIELLREYRKAVISEAVTKGLDPDAPMKDSGVEWIGEIPEGWSITRLKYICSMTSGATPSKERLDYWQGNIPWVSSKEVKAGELWDTSLHISQEGMNSCSTELLPAGTLVTVVRSGILKHTLPISELKIPMTINQDIKALSFSHSYLAKWFRLFVEGLNDSLLYALKQDGATVDSLNIESFQNCPLPLPPKDEIEKICKWGFRKTADIDALIADKERQVELLREYRKSLISEAVTGKFKVPGVE